jgi:hypothetical protein
VSNTKPLTVMQRLANYDNQYGRPLYTARQLRRVKHKAGKAQAKVQKERANVEQA